MTFTEKLQRVFSIEKNGEWAERISSEIRYLYEISKTKENKYDGIIEKAVDFVLEEYESCGAVTKAVTLEAENLLTELKPIAKSYTELFIAHAHIDMNWEWGYNETASITVDTFRTVINLMNEYPQMTFAQSQASTYEIIEKYCPELLGEIKKLIKEGRWEVTASQWVEPDNNMACGEALTRHTLQTRKYLSELLDIDPLSMDIDFVPDTFGHNINLPEILNNCKVKYLYHCRGKKDKSCLYYYVAPSGKKVLSYMEYAWYNGVVSPEKFCILPAFCAENRINTYLCIFGIGDHGGGPSRRDIERIMKYMTWPYTPVMRFGTMHEFFRDAEEAERAGVKFPEITDEMNCIFTGCYTTQTRIKAANKIGETRTLECEALAAEKMLLTDKKTDESLLDIPWRNILFNQFHDILPGSGTVETREYAMGKFQETLAKVNILSNSSVKDIADDIDTTGIGFSDESGTVSEGGGAGFTQSQWEDYRIPATERGRGKVRAFNIFNTTAYERDETVYITVWDYPYGFSNATVRDKDGNELPFTLLEQGKGYWSHSYTRIAVTVAVPPLGYTTLVLSQKEDLSLPCRPWTAEHSDEFINEDNVVLENKYLKAEFDYITARLVSLLDKESGKELISQPSCYFRMTEEDPKFQMTAWRTGPAMKVTDLNESCGSHVREIRHSENLSHFTYKLFVGDSVIDCKVSLGENDRTIRFDTKVDWREFSETNVKILQLAFAVPLSYNAGESAVYDIPYGSIRRQAKSHDVPALSYMDMNGVSLISETKYGFRFCNNTGSLTLIRSAYDPDPYPEVGKHDIRFGVSISKDTEREAECFRKPLYAIAATKHGGRLPLEKGTVSLEGKAYIAAIKPSEDGEGIAVRLYTEENSRQTVTLGFFKPAVSAEYTDSLENKIEEAELQGGKAVISIPAFSTVTVKIKF